MTARSCRGGRVLLERKVRSRLQWPGANHRRHGSVGSTVWNNRRRKNSDAVGAVRATTPRPVCPASFPRLPGLRRRRPSYTGSPVFRTSTLFDRRVPDIWISKALFRDRILPQSRLYMRARYIRMLSVYYFH